MNYLALAVFLRMCSVKFEVDKLWSLLPESFPVPRPEPKSPFILTQRLPSVLLSAPTDGYFFKRRQTDLQSSKKLTEITLHIDQVAFSLMLA